MLVPTADLVDFGHVVAVETEPRSLTASEAIAAMDLKDEDQIALANVSSDGDLVTQTNSMKMQPDVDDVSETLEVHVDCDR